MVRCLLRTASRRQEDETTLWIAKPDEGQRDTASHLRQFSVVTDAQFDLSGQPGEILQTEQCARLLCKGVRAPWSLQSDHDARLSAGSTMQDCKLSWEKARKANMLRCNWRLCAASRTWKT